MYTEFAELRSRSSRSLFRRLVDRRNNTDYSESSVGGGGGFVVSGVYECRVSRLESKGRFTYPMMELVAIMKSVSWPFITFALKSFDFVCILRNLSGLTRSRYTALVLSPT